MTEIYPASDATVDRASHPSSYCVTYTESSLPSRPWSCRSSCRVYTTATPRSPDYTADYTVSAQRRCQTNLPVPARHTSSAAASLAGCGPDSVSTSNSLSSFFVASTVWRHVTYPTTYVVSPTPIAGVCARCRQLY